LTGQIILGQWGIENTSAFLYYRKEVKGAQETKSRNAWLETIRRKRREGDAFEPTGVKRIFRSNLDLIKGSPKAKQAEVLVKKDVSVNKGSLSEKGNLLHAIEKKGSGEKLGKLSQ